MFASRRRVLVGALALSAVGSVRSQSRRWAALSLVGNKIEIVGARPEIGSRISQNRRNTLDDAEGTLSVGEATVRLVRAS